MLRAKVFRDFGDIHRCTQARTTSAMRNMETQMNDATRFSRLECHWNLGVAPIRSMFGRRRLGVGFRGVTFPTSEARGMCSPGSGLADSLLGIWRGADSPVSVR